MSKHRAVRKLQRHQQRRLLQHYIHLVRVWIKDQLTDLPDIINDIKTTK